MKATRRITAILAIALAAATMTGCGEKAKRFFAHDGTYPDESSVAETEASAEVTTPVRTETTPASVTTNVTEPPIKPPISANEQPQDDDTKLLWSERGLEIVPIDSQGGYGSELKAGETYLGWNLISFDGQVNGDTVTDLQADFVYGSGELSVNGIVTILSASDANNPNGLYLRVDNQAEFPYFPADTRERGKFIVENKDAVYKMLGYETAADVGKSEIAVTMSVKSLHIHYSADGFDTIVVTAASLR